MSKQIEINRQYAIELLEEAVKARGADYVYQKPSTEWGEGSKCVYTDRDSRPSCIVGYALANAGVPIEVLHAIDYGGATYDEDYDYENHEYVELYRAVSYEGLSESGITDNDVVNWLKENNVYIDERALHIFSDAQHEQDSGKTWGVSVEKAIAKGADSARF